jgi:hypothetical protein
MSSIDIIIPCYRYGHFLRQCVESVLTQSVRNIRVLIIDDASPDDTAKVGAALVKEDSRVTYIRHASNKGHIRTYNEGIDWVSADYMLLLSADDYLLPDALSRAIKLMDEHPEVGFIFGKALSHEDNEITGQSKFFEGSTEKLDWRILEGLEYIELSGSRNFVRTPTAVVRTQLQKRLGGYRLELPHSGDMEMWLRFAAHASVGILNANQAVYRLHQGNMSHSYMADNALLDIQQRKAAFNCFFQTCRDVLPDYQQLSRKLFKLLGCDAVGLASTAFNNGEMKISEQLSTLAIEIYPPIKSSLQWMKLSCKRRLGFKLWCILRPLVIRIYGLSALSPNQLFKWN